MAGIFIIYRLSRGTHHRIVAATRSVCLESSGEICRVLSGEVRAGQISADALCTVAARTGGSLGLPDDGIACLGRYLYRRQVELRRMRIMTNNALLRPGMIGDHDLTLLERPSRYPFMAKRAKLSRVSRDDQLEIIRVIGAGSRSFERATNVALTAGAVTHLAFNNFSDVGAVVHAIGPSVCPRRYPLPSHLYSDRIRRTN